VYLKFDPPIGTTLPSAMQAAIYGVSVLLSGAALYCLGAIVDHLKAIRNFQRRQIDLNTPTQLRKRCGIEAWRQNSLIQIGSNRQCPRAMKTLPKPPPLRRSS
jgi:hypothetical protein